MRNHRHLENTVLGIDLLALMALIVSAALYDSGAIQLPAFMDVAWVCGGIVALLIIIDWFVPL